MPRVPMTEDHKKKLVLARKATMEQRKMGTRYLLFRDEYRVYRMDDLNWCPEVLQNGKWESYGYYSSLANAMVALAEKVNADGEDNRSIGQYVKDYENITKELKTEFYGRTTNG